MGWLTQLALDASIWPLPPPLECVWEILDQRSQRCPISPYWRSRRRSGGKKPSKKGGFLAISWFFCSWDLPAPPGGEYCIPKFLAQNFRKAETGGPWLRPLPTMCGALGSHRIEKSAKKSAHFGELRGVLATLTIKRLLSEWFSLCFVFLHSRWILEQAYYWTSFI